MARRTATRALAQPQGPQTLYLPQGPTPGSVFAPRSYQLPPIRSWEAGCKRLVLVYPRRHGKDLTCLAITQKGMMRRPGLYWHIYPTLKRGRLAMWDGKDFSGVPFRDRFPASLVADRANGPGGKAINDAEMQIELKPLPGQPSGSIWQVMGADDPDSLAGPNPVGVVFSEYQLHDPRCWTKIIQPILAENGGWAIFDFTPEGENHAYDLFQSAQKSPKWFAQLITVRETRRDAHGEDGGPVIAEEDDPARPDRESIAEMRRNGTPEEEIQSQYYCSFKGSIRGAIFGDCMTRAEAEKRVAFCPYEPALPVGTAWDIGRDTTAIWFWQEVQREIRFIDYVEDRGKDMGYYVHLLKERRSYLYGEHLFPHDMAVTEWTQTESRLRKVEALGLQPAYVADKLAIEDTIDATRRCFGRCIFDAGKCAEGLKALRGYKYEFDEKKQTFGRIPVHDWASHGGSALRTFAVAFQEGRMQLHRKSKSPRPVPAGQSATAWMVA